MFIIASITSGNFAGLWYISRTDILSGFVGNYESIQKIREDWIASGLQEIK